MDNLPVVLLRPSCSQPDFRRADIAVPVLPPHQDGNTDYDGIRKAIENAKNVTDKPSIIKVCTSGTTL